MPLAPRPPYHEPPPPKPRAPGKSSKGPSSGATPAGQKAVRQRRADVGLPTNPTPQVLYPHVDWSEVEDVVEWVTDVVGKMSHSQVGSTGNVVTSINSPKAYAHATLDAHLASMDSMVYIRIYRVSHDFFRAKLELQAAAAAILEAEINEQLNHLAEFGLQGTMFETEVGG